MADRKVILGQEAVQIGVYMADNNWGGYRQPSNPAPVSLPGALSSRTDGGPIDGMQPANTQPARYMPGLGYGKGGENMAIQQAEPLAGNPVPNVPAPIPLNAPDRYPGIPSTDIVTGKQIGRAHV